MLVETTEMILDFTKLILNNQATLLILTNLEQKKKKIRTILL